MSQPFDRVFALEAVRVTEVTALAGRRSARNLVKASRPNLSKVVKKPASVVVKL